MIRNIIKSTFVACVLAFSLGSCENDFDAKIYGKLSTTNFPATAADYESYLMDCYIPFTVTWSYNLSGSNMHNFYVSEGGLNRLFDMTTDESSPWRIGSWGGAFTYYGEAQFEDMKLAGRGSMVPSNHYEKIRDVTRFTKIIGDIEAADPAVLPTELQQEYLGEARLLRGLMMYYLLHMYGPVPVILDPSLVGDDAAEAALERPTLDEMTQYIADDLEFAVGHVAETQSEKGRYTADYARFCLMRHYLNEGYHVNGYYQKAYDLFGQFKGSYSLFQNGDNPYAAQFMIANKFNCETIMAVSCNENATGNGSEGNFNPFSWYALSWEVSKYDDKGNPTPFVKQGGGWGQTFNISKHFYDTFEEGDKRAETIITRFFHIFGYWVTEEHLGSVWDGFIINKYPIETETPFQGTDIPLARWADVLLLYAEADVRAHNTVSAQAIDCVNQVRQRAGLHNLDPEKTASKEAFLDALIMERGHELYYEGCRKIDLIRFNKYYTLLKEAGKDPSSQYFPLPDYAVKQAEECGKTLTQYFTRDNYDGPKR